MMGSQLKLVRIEEILVGVFGAVIGGEMATANFTDGTPGGLAVLPLAVAIAGAALLLVLLKMMRSAVGPLRSRKKPTARR